MKLTILGVGFVGLVMSSCWATTTIEKIFHNQQAASRNALELGQLVVYFDKQPQIKGPLRDAQGELVFFFEDTRLSREAANLLAALKKTGPDNSYGFALQVTQSPAGLKLSLTFDSEKVDCQSDTYIVVTMQDAMVFRFYNKELLARTNSNKKLLKTACARKPVIAIDCGHGGFDTGAIGHFKVAHHTVEIKEKDLALEVGRQLADNLKKQGCDFFFIRNSDVAVSLDQRTTIANLESNADILVSIHANHASNPAASGVETFCLTPNLFKTCYSTLNAPRASAVKQVLDERCAASNRLASCVHTTLVHQIKEQRPEVVDRHVKNSVPQVLLGTTKPSILVELGFLSHPKEARFLNDHVTLVADAISKGCAQYLFC